MIPRNYVTNSVKPTDWEDIEAFYADMINTHARPLQELLDLVKYIHRQKLSERLYAYTSLTSLNISMYNPIELNREMLKIDYDAESKNWNLNYYSLPFNNVEFSKIYPEGVLVEKFIAFINYIKW